MSFRYPLAKEIPWILELHVSSKKMHRSRAPGKTGNWGKTQIHIRNSTDLRLQRQPENPENQAKLDKQEKPEKTWTTGKTIKTGKHDKQEKQEKLEKPEKQDKQKNQENRKNNKTEESHTELQASKVSGPPSNGMGA